MANNIGPKIGVQGEGEFRKEIQQINTSLKTMGTEMDLVTSSFIGNEKSVEALTAKNEVLQKKFDELSKKAEVQRSRLAELDAAGVDPTSASYQKLVQDLNKTETQLNKTEAEIKSNSAQMDNLGKETDEAAKSMDEGGAASKRFGDNLKANLLSEAITAGVKALGAGLKKIGSAVLDAASAADDLNTLSLQTGLSTAELQKFEYATGTIDVSLDTLAGSFTKLTSNMANAADGSGAAAEAFDALGVQVTDGDGALRDRNAVFQETIAALGKIENATERDALAMKVFGKSAQDLNPLILGGAAALDELGSHAESAGLLLSQSSLDALATVNDRFDVLKQTLALAGQNFLAQFAEPLTMLIDKVIGYVEKLVATFEEGGFSKLGETVGEIATDIATTVTSYLPKVAEFATTLILTLTQGLIQMLPTLVQSAITIVTTFATGLAETLPELIPVAVDAILTLVDTLTDPDNIGNLVDAALAIMMALANGVIAALPKLLEKAPVIISNLVTALVENIPKLLEGAAELIGGIVKGLIDALPQIGKAAGEIVGTLLKGLADVWQSVLDAGANIVAGIWQGIQNSYATFWANVKSFFTGIIDGVKSVLGIASPSKVFAGIGSNMALGIGVGFERSMDKVEREMQSSIPTSFDTTVNGGVVTATGVGGTGVIEEITIPVNVGDVELARVLYRHIVGEGERLGAAMVM